MTSLTSNVIVWDAVRDSTTSESRLVEQNIKLVPNTEHQDPVLLLFESAIVLGEIIIFPQIVMFTKRGSSNFYVKSARNRDRLKRLSRLTDRLKDLVVSVPEEKARL